MSIIFCDVAGPIPGSVSISSLLAELMSSFPAAAADFFVVVLVVVVVCVLVELACAAAGMPVQSRRRNVQKAVIAILFIGMLPNKREDANNS